MAKLWDLSENASSYEILIDRRSDFRHRFGGQPSHSGIIPARGKAPIHLVMTFDLSDGRVPFAQPSVNELPLFYPFQYNGSGLSYQVLDDSAVEIIEQPGRDFLDDFPFEDYPQIFQQLPISLSDRISIDQYFEDDFLQQRWEEELTRAAEEARVPDEVDRIALVEGLMQGPPRSVCPTPACDQQPMKLLTVLRGDLISGFHFWSVDKYGPEVDITYEYCPNCFVIHTENQCD
jgi:hypothetical protein